MQPFERGWEDRDVWVTRDLRVLSPAEMETSHLESTLKMLESKASALKHVEDIEWAMMKGPTGDMASLGFEQEQCAFFDMIPMEWLRDTRIYKALRAEYDRRQLQLVGV